MTKYILLSVMSISFMTGYSQAFDSTDFQIVTLQDTLISGINKFHFQMTTQNNNANSGYADFIFIDQNGDTINAPTNWSMWLPESNDPTYDTTSYILDFKVGFNSFPTDFNGHLRILNPDCTIPFTFATLSTEDLIELNPDIQLYPNPTSDPVRVLNKSNLAISSVELYGSDGKLVLAENFNSGLISVNTLKPGMYVVKFRSDGNVVAVKKLIKK